MPTPTVAIAIATRDRPVSLGRLIDALLAQSHRPEQVLIIDDGQLADDLLAGWRERCETAGVKLVYHRKDRPGRSASRNLAATLTECETICFLDDDCEPAAEFLERMLAGIDSYGRWEGPCCEEASRSDDSPDAMPATAVMPQACSTALVAVEGMVIPPGGPRLGDRVYAAILFLSGWWRLAPCRGPKKLGDNLRARPVLCGVCLVRQSALAAVPFDESLSHGEDREWSVRLARLGRLGRVTDAVCVHHTDPAGRGGGFRTGVRIARNYLASQRKLFGRLGAIFARVTLTALTIGEFGMGLAASLFFRKSGPARLARSLGLLAGMFSPHGPRAD